MKNLNARLLLILLVALLIGCNSAEPTSTPVVIAETDTPESVAQVEEPTATVVAATDTPAPSPTASEIPTEAATIGPPATFTPVPTSTPLPATNTPTNTPTPEFTSTPTLTPTPTPGPKPPPRPGANASPGNPTPYLSRYQLITFYGSPWGRSLGILGNQPIRDTLRLLWGVVAEYQPLDSRFAMPTYHMVTTVANQRPPEYRHHVDLPTIEVWIANANNNEAAVILDIQPGRVPLIDEFNRIRNFLYNPHVHLALDPEFQMTDEQIPNVHVGQITADDINMIQAELNQIALEMGVKRVLIIHQFKDSMIVNKSGIQNFPHVELVIDSDGAFNSDIKVYNYLQYSNEPGFEYGGIKIFYEYDDRILTPEEVMRLGPKPAVIIYQ